MGCGFILPINLEFRVASLTFILVSIPMTTKSYFRIYFKAMFSAFAVVWLFFVLQATFVLKEFKLEFIIVPSLLAIVIGGAIAKIAILKRKLLEQHALLRALTDFGQEFLYLRNAQGQFQYVSPYCKELTGYSPEEFYQNPQQMDMLIHNEDLALWNQHVEHMFHSKGESESLVIRIVSKSGAVRWINHVCSSVFDYEGRFQGVRSSNIDITKREELEQLKDQFLKRMSHEFRTPMNGILGCADLIHAEIATDSDLKKYIEIIQSSSERLMQTLDNILELTRLGNSQVAFYSNKPIDLLAMTQRLINLYQLRARVEGKNLQLGCTHRPEQISVMLPSEVLDCILKNLLDNAFKFSEMGQIMVDLHLNHDSIDISVKDQGIGIEPNFLPLIFEEFIQGSEGDTRHFDGTGIGLSVVKKLLEGMHGTIQVTSELQHGTTVTLQLPLPYSPPQTTKGD
jgi:PAS domain S-box-containing protein